ELVTALAEATGARIVPVDSEHTALHQLLAGQPPGAVERLTITASGRPFRGRSREQLQEVTVEQALAHPTWAMGGKIPIDSATLMNKGLEVMEAHHLFGTPYERIDVVVHPQSLVHGVLQLADGGELPPLRPPEHAHRHLLRASRRRERPAADPTARPRRGRLADLRAGRSAGIPLPAPRPRSRKGGWDRAVRAQRRQRDRRPRVPAGAPALPGDPGRDRADALGAGQRAGDLLRVAVRGRPPGARARRPVGRRAQLSPRRLPAAPDPARRTDGPAKLER